MEDLRECEECIYHSEKGCSQWECVVTKSNNLKKIKKLDTWNLARFLYQVSNGATEITNCKEMCNECEYSESYCISGIAEWLLSEDKGEL